MAHTNSTPNYNLPQFLGTDKPAWLTDVNNAMSDIDTAIAAAKTTADTANATATALGVTVGNHTTQLSTLSGAVTSQGNTLNTVTSLIGNGVPTTTDQTIIGAINELHANQGDLTTLTTVDKSSLVAAINEVAGGGGSPAASAVSYDNTGSGLTASNVQDAIDELAQGGATLKFEKCQVTDTVSANGKKITTVGETVPTGYEIASVSIVNTGDSDLSMSPIVSGGNLSVLTYSKSASSLSMTADVYLTYKPQ